MKKDLHPLCALFFFIISFLFCSADSFGQFNPVIEGGNSYVDISKKTTGGFVQVGDTLEIRTNYFWGSTYNTASAGNLYNVRYFDSVPVKTTMLTGATDSLRLITNEGLTFRNYTLAANDDAGTYTASPSAGQYQIRINIGSSPSKPLAASPGLLTDITGASTVKIGTYKPLIFGGTLLTTSFRVKVTGTPGDTIVLGIGKLVYQKTSGGADTIISATPYMIFISTSTSSTLCGNALNNNLAGEKSGTFDSGTVLNRSYALSFPIPDYDYVQASPTVAVGDGTYAIVNNSSPLSSTAINSRYAPNCTTAPAVPLIDSCRNRMFGGFWDIIGDHTGTNNSAGNPPVAAGTKGGYMLEVNADVVTTQAYNHSITGLCPSTYYEFSAWVRNLCKNCAIDSNSTQTYKPGVLPNLSFNINGLDYYSSGQLDTVGWQKKGFVFQTGPSETAAVISIRNNASGGGGNDWVLDDISLGTCGPSTVYNFNPYLLGCSSGVLVNMNAVVKYTYNPTYSYYVWQKSTDGGTTWVNTSATGSASPVLSGGSYQFTTNYPPFMAYGSDSGSRYRVTVATSNANLSSTACSFTDGNSILLKIINCGSIVKADILSFKGELSTDNKTTLSWSITSEINLSHYDIEKSIDGKTFNNIGEIMAKNLGTLTSYNFNDPETVNGNVYYRLKIWDDKGLYKYSNITMVSRFLNFEVRPLENPFSELISADIILPADGDCNVWLFDSYGRPLKSKAQKMYRGLNNLMIGDLDNLTNGVYTLYVEYNHQVVQKKLIKITHK
jgi:hypothetical protein